MNKTAQDAIARSISHNEIVHVDFDQEAHEALIETAKEDGGDWTVNGDETEFWGGPGQGWRVHMRMTE